MNIYINKALKKYKCLFINNNSIVTNLNLLNAIYSIEIVHRNIIWRIMEYIYWIIMPRKYSIKQILTIGKFQIKVCHLNQYSKLRCIKLSNDIRIIDKVLFDNIKYVNWNSLTDENIKRIVKFYNGDKTNMYFNGIKTLIKN
jgi:hypothetical protein